MKNSTPANLKSWKRDWSLMNVFFSGNEVASIAERLNQLKIHTIAFCSFENRFARSGGLSAVTTNILPFLKEVNHIPSVILITPYYPEIIDQGALQPTGHSFDVSYNKKSVHAEILEYTWKYKHPAKGALKEYYIKADGFFDAGKGISDPYAYDRTNKDRNASLQCENALFFCKAVPLALQALNIRENIIFHLHEWQTALISLTAKNAMLNGTLQSCGTVQTMHNSYDTRISRDMLSSLLENSERSTKYKGPKEDLSAYQIGLQLVDAPVTTVSEHFAGELTNDLIQTGHYAPHLQRIMNESGVYGVNNGMFVDFSPEFPKGEKHTLDEVRNIKLKNRKALLKVLSTYKPSERFGDLTYKGRTISKLPDHVPVIVMSGRLDPIQKGYYVLLRAIERFAQDEIKAVLAPMPVSPSDLDYFYEIACKCRGNITVFPVRMQKGYQELQTGATFGIMPSIYEPFGAAVEYMASGTVNIGRATGGLVDQIDKKCGFLYREDEAFYTTENLKGFIESAHFIQARKNNLWAESMAQSLYDIIRKAVKVYQEHPEDYYRMILSGFRKAGQFNWEDNAEKYHRIYSMISRA
jgi:glycogen synthase